MEWQAPKAICSLAASPDGMAQILFSEGTVLPGDRLPGAEAVWESAARFCELAAELRRLFKPAPSVAFPRPGHVQFLLVTEDGVLAATARERDLSARRHDFWRLYFSAHEVTHALYQLDERRHAERRSGPGTDGEAD